jgi:hypothetical protein
MKCVVGISFAVKKCNMSLSTLILSVLTLCRSGGLFSQDNVKSVAVSARPIVQLLLFIPRRDSNVPHFCYAELLMSNEFVMGEAINLLFVLHVPFDLSGMEHATASITVWVFGTNDIGVGTGNKMT